MIRPCLQGERRPIPFEPGGWRAEDSQSPAFMEASVRYRMVADLLDKNLLIDKDPQAVLQLLGEPDRGKSPQEYQYWVAKTFNDLEIVLSVQFANHRVRECRLKDF